MTKVLSGGDAWFWNSDSEVVSAPCGLCGGECVGAGFSNRFWSLQLFCHTRARLYAPLVVALCDRCEPHICEGEVVRLQLKGVNCGTAVVDALHRAND